jgi:hypothetical protein
MRGQHFHSSDMEKSSISPVAGLFPGVIQDIDAELKELHNDPDESIVLGIIMAVVCTHHKPPHGIPCKNANIHEGKEADFPAHGSAFSIMAPRKRSTALVCLISAEIAWQVGNCIATLGLNLQRYAQTRGDPRVPYTEKRLWWAGVCCMVLGE